MYSSATEEQAEDIVNVGQKYVRVVDENCTESWAKFQMCSGLGRDKFLGSGSRLVESGQSVVFRIQSLGVTHRTTPRVQNEPETIGASQRFRVLK